MKEFFARDNAEWLTSFLDSYGPVAKVNGFFGVCDTLSLSALSFGKNIMQQIAQARWLHVYDPKALHSVHVRDQESYDRGHRTITCVSKLRRSSNQL